MIVRDRSKALVVLVTVFLTGSVLILDRTAAYAQTTTERVNVSSIGNESNDGSWAHSSISKFGQFVVFSSYASNLVSDDINNRGDIFFHDRLTGDTSRVSVNWNGVDADGYSYFPDISADGRYVSFHSLATDLDGIDTNGTVDVFVRDRSDARTSVVSINSDGMRGNGTSYFAAMSADSRYVAFESDATNLVVDHVFDYRDIFVHDRQTGETTCITEWGDDNSNQAAISGNGRFVAFTSHAANFIYTPTPPPPTARKILYPVDTNGVPDIYIYDQLTQTMERVSVDSDGVEANGTSYHPAVSEDGRYVAFMSYATNLIPDDTNGAGDVFVHDRHTGVTERVGESVDNFEGLGSVAISDDGRFVAFASRTDSLVPGDTNGETDVFVRDRATGVLERVSLSQNGDQGNNYSIFPSISGDGENVAFMSVADNLVAFDTNDTSDVFVRTDWETVVLFSDEFEAGDVAKWSNAFGSPEESCIRAHHDGSAETYVFVKEAYPDGIFVGKFSPNRFPFSPTKVEIGWTQGEGTSSWHEYEIVFYDDDGPNGAPGTLLGSMPASAAYIPPANSVANATGNVLSVIGPITTGSIYVGAHWTWRPGGVAIGVDQASTSYQQSFFGLVGEPIQWTEAPSTIIRSLLIGMCGY